MANSLAAKKQALTLPLRALRLEEYNEADEERFVRVFHDAWNKLPALQQTEILFSLMGIRDPYVCVILPEEWGKESPIPPFAHGSIPNYIPYTWVYSEYRSWDEWMVFHAGCVDRMPDEILEVLIVQTLGQVWAQPSNSPPVEPGIVQYLADSWAAGCGFDPFAVDVWSQCNIQSWSRQDGITWHQKPRQEDRMRKMLFKTCCGFKNARSNRRYLNAQGRPIVIDAQKKLSYADVSASHRLVDMQY